MRPPLVSALLRDPAAPLAYSIMSQVNVDGSRLLRDGAGAGLQPTALRCAAAMATDATE